MKETIEEVEILTKKEKLVIFYLAQGLTNREMSTLLITSTHTVKAHLASIYEKLQVANRLQAVIKALQIGEITLAQIKVASTDIESRYE